MKVSKVLKRILWKSVVLKVIQILIFSQIVLAQSVSDGDINFEDQIVDDDKDFREVKIQEVRDDYQFEERKAKGLFGLVRV